MEFHAEGFPAFVSISIFLFIFFIIPVTVIAYIFSKLHARKIRSKYLNSSVIKSEYKPPANLSPAEIGYLFDSKAGGKESIATLLDLEQRKIIKINKTDQGTYNIHLDNPTSEKLKPHEELIVNSISSMKNISVGTGSIFFGFNSAVRQSLKKEGLISPTSHILKQFFAKVFLSYIVICFLIFIGIIFLFKGNILFITIFSIMIFIIFIPVFLALAVIAAYINNIIAGHSGIWNKKAKQLWPEIEGYREYIRQVEIDEIQFESEQLKIKSKNRAMPYAVAFGFNTNWHKRNFDQIK